MGGITKGQAVSNFIDRQIGRYQKNTSPIDPQTIVVDKWRQPGDLFKYADEVMLS